MNIRNGTNGLSASRSRRSTSAARTYLQVSSRVVPCGTEISGTKAQLTLGARKPGTLCARRFGLDKVKLPERNGFQR
jgi:hypothetical protein